MRTLLVRLLGGLSLIGLPACTGPSGPGTQCDLSSATAITHTSGPTASETWASGVHRVPSSLTVPVGVTLTIAACSRVELGADAGLTVDGKLVVAGTSDGAVDFVAAGSQPWGAVQLNPNGEADLAFANFTGGGGSAPAASSATLGAPIFVHGVGAPPPAPLKVTQVKVAQPTGVGVALVDAGFAAGSTALTVTGAGSFPVYLGADVVGGLPDGAYTGNARDAIALQSAFAAAQDNQRPILADVTFHDRGVPYCVGMKDAGEIVVGRIGNPAPLVTVEAGVTLGFTRGQTPGGRLRVVADTGANPTLALGAVSAVGTADRPIKFTSCAAAPAPGDWIGLTFSGVDARTRLEHVAITSAGADSGVVGVCLTHANTADADAALQVMFQQGAPSQPFLVSSSISDSAASGIFRGWNGPDIDFLAGNTLSGIAWCAQTLVPDLANACAKTTCPTAP